VARVIAVTFLLFYTKSSIESNAELKNGTARLLAWLPVGYAMIAGWQGIPTRCGSLRVADCRVDGVGFQEADEWGNEIVADRKGRAHQAQSEYDQYCNEPESSGLHGSSRANMGFGDWLSSCR
jgi:hypothetical protein